MKDDEYECCAECENALEDKKFIATDEGGYYEFCSKKCARKYIKSNVDNFYSEEVN